MLLLLPFGGTSRGQFINKNEEEETCVAFETNILLFFALSTRNRNSREKKVENEEKKKR